MIVERDNLWCCCSRPLYVVVMFWPVLVEAACAILRWFSCHKECVLIVQRIV